jgi:hypothetical protein
MPSNFGSPRADQQLTTSTKSTQQNAPLLRPATLSLSLATMLILLCALSVRIRNLQKLYIVAIYIGVGQQTHKLAIARDESRT